MRTLRRIIVISGILLFGHGGTCFSEDIVIFGNESKPPKYYLENGKAKGILVDIMKYADRHLPQSFSYKLLPWRRAYENALNGMGGVVGLSMTKGRLEIFDYSDVMFYDELVLVVLKGKEFPFNSIEDLKGKRVGVQRGSSYGDEFENTKGLFMLDLDDSGEQRLLKLLARHIDVAVIGPGQAGVMMVICKNEELTRKRDEFVILANPFKRDPNYLGFTKEMNMRGFLHVFNGVLKKGLDSGAIEEIVDSYLDQSWPNHEAERPRPEGRVLRQLGHPALETDCP